MNLFRRKGILEEQILVIR